MSEMPGRGTHGLRWLPLAAGLVGFGVVLAVMAFTRGYPGFGTESDLLGGFIPEARLLLRGEPLTMDFQPPLYPMLLGLGYLVHPDWFRVGLFLSWIFALLSLWLNFTFFHSVFGRAAAWGSFAGLATSGAFLAYGAQATSDVPFLFFYSATILSSVAVLQRDRAGPWAFLTGALIAGTLLLRVNGLPLLLLGVVPWLRSEDRRIRLTNTGLMAGGLVLVMAAWGGVAYHTGSPGYPTDNYANLAMTYYGEGDRVSVEDRLAMEERFSGTLDVVAHDPAHLLTGYLRDLVQLPSRFLVSDQLLALPLMLLALPGVLLLFFQRPSPYPLLFLLLVVGHVLFLNLKTFEPRYFLFLVPVLGAGAGVMAMELTRALRHRWAAVVTGVVLAGLLVLGTRSGLIRAQAELTRSEAELGEAVPLTRQILEPGDLVVARKRHIPFHAGAERWMMPVATTTAELLGHLASLDPERPTYLYFGMMEEALRPELRHLRDPLQAPEVFHLVASGDVTPWVLYRLDLASLRQTIATPEGGSQESHR